MNHQNLVHVHVGKCAGSTLNTCLHEAGVSFVELHGHGADKQLEAILDLGVSEINYIITIRDPISRFISAFWYDKHRALTGQGPAITRLEERLWTMVFTHFPHPSALAEGLESAQEGTRVLAAKAMSPQYRSHMGLGLSAYITPALIQRLPKDKAFLIRQEMAAVDIRMVFSAMGLRKPGNVPRINNFQSLHSREFGAVADARTLSETAQSALRSWLREEFHVFGLLLKAFGNQSKLEKLAE